MVRASCLPLALGLGIVICDLLAEQLCRAVRQIVRQGGKGLFRLPQEGIAGIGHRICLPGRSKPGVQARQKQADQRQSLVKWGLQQPGEHGGLCLPGQDLLHAVVIAVLIVKVQIGREVLSDLRVLDVFLDEVLIGLQAQKRTSEAPEVSGDPNFKLVFTKVDGTKLTTEFYLADDGLYDVLSDQNLPARISKMDVQKIISYYEDMINPETETESETETASEE